MVHKVRLLWQVWQYEQQRRKGLKPRRVFFYAIFFLSTETISDRAPSMETVYDPDRSGLVASSWVHHFFFPFLFFRRRGLSMLSKWMITELVLRWWWWWWSPFSLARSREEWHTTRRTKSESGTWDSHAQHRRREEPNKFVFQIKTTMEDREMKKK